MSAKEERSKAGGSFDGHTTLRRTIVKQNSNSSSDTSTFKGPLQNRRQNVDSGYSTCDGLERRWSQELTISNDAAKWSPTPMHIRPMQTDQNQYVADSSPTSTAASTQYPNSSCNEINPSGAENPCDSEQKQSFTGGSHTNRYFCFYQRKNFCIFKLSSVWHSNDDSPDGDYSPDSQRSDEKLKSLGNVQTYRYLIGSFLMGLKSR